MTTSNSGARTAGAVALAVGGLIDIASAVLTLAGPADALRRSMAAPS
jgi:hypothetical protein